MKQHSIDLMPESIRLRTQAGMRMGQFIAAAAVGVLLFVALATHARFSLRAAEAELATVTVHADQVLATEAKAAELVRELNELRSFSEMYYQAALPLELSAVMATLVNALPESVTLDQLDLDASGRMVARSPRAKDVRATGDLPPRVLSGQISGFAASDQQIAELVSRLEATPPFRNVSLDFSRTRDVRKQLAREFRLSFKIDLDMSYQVVEAGRRRSAALEEIANAH